MMFGPDGFLYVALGDGGDSNDPLNNAQNTTELLGKILRIDVNVPDDNEQGFVTPEGNAGLPRPEIWSLGWRNPWRFSFDDPAKGGTGAMVIADVGQEGWEETCLRYSSTTTWSVGPIRAAMCTAASRWQACAGGISSPTSSRGGSGRWL
jgi:hypothetical protein